MGKRRLKTTINEKTYILVGNYSQEHLQYASELTQQQLSQIMRLSPELDSEQSAILLALNTISTQINLEQEILKLRKRVSKLEYELLEAKHNDYGTQKGVLDNVNETLSSEESNVGFGQQMQMTEKTYIPAILKKEGHES